MPVARRYLPNAPYGYPTWRNRCRPRRRVGTADGAAGRRSRQPGIDRRSHTLGCLTVCRECQETTTSVETSEPHCRCTPATGGPVNGSPIRVLDLLATVPDPDGRAGSEAAAVPTPTDEKPANPPSRSESAAPAVLSPPACSSGPCSAPPTDNSPRIQHHPAPDGGDRAGHRHQPPADRDTIYTLELRRRGVNHSGPACDADPLSEDLDG